MPQIVPGGPAPEMPQPPPIDPSQMPLSEQITPVEGQGITEEKKQALLDMINVVREKLGSFNATKFAGDAKIESLRSSLLQQVFEKLQLAGVDLTSQESVAAFIERLKQTNPELAVNFEKAMDVLLDGSGMPGAPQDSNESMDLGVMPQNMNNENQNEQESQTTQNIPQG